MRQQLFPQVTSTSHPHTDGQSPLRALIGQATASALPLCQAPAITPAVTQNSTEVR